MAARGELRECFTARPLTTAGMLAGRLLIALILALLALGAITLGAYFGLGWVFGFTGNPAGTDLPPVCYTIYGVGAPLLCLAAALWLVFRRRD